MLRSDRKRTTLVATVAGCLAMAGTAFAQMQPSTPAQPTTPSYSSPDMQMSAVTPSKSEISTSAFAKLDTSHRGYVTREQVAKLDGFDDVFTQADKNKDGKLSQDEFNAAWAVYTGNTKG